MNRLIVVCSVGVLLTGGAVAHGQWAKYDPAVKKLMPKDQLEIVERMEAVAEQHKTLLSRIKDPKQRREENETLAAEARGIQAELVKKLQTEGLTGWGGVCNTILPNNAVMLDTFQPLVLNLKLSDKGKPVGTAEQDLRSIKINDVVRFSTKADPTNSMPRVASKTFSSVCQTIGVESLTSAEKVGTWKPAPPAPPTAKAPPAGRRKKSK